LSADLVVVPRRVFLGPAFRVSLVLIPADLVAACFGCPAPRPAPLVTDFLPGFAAGASTLFLGCVPVLFGALPRSPTAMAPPKRVVGLLPLVTSLVTALMFLPVRSSNLAIGEIRRILASLRANGADDRLFEVALARLRLLFLARSILFELIMSRHVDLLSPLKSSSDAYRL
jgi:hypothetical protein